MAASTRFFVPRMELARAESGVAAFADSGTGYQAMDNNPDFGIKYNATGGGFLSVDVEDSASVNTVGYTLNWAGMWCRNPAVMFGAGAGSGFLKIWSGTDPAYIVISNRGQKNFSAITETQHIAARTIADQTDRFWLIEVSGTTSIFDVGIVWVGQYFDINARFNYDAPDTSAIFNSQTRLVSGRILSRNMASRPIRRWVRRYELIDDTDMQAIRDVYALARGSHVPFIMSDDIDNAEEGWLVRFAASTDAGLNEREIVNGLWNVDLLLEEIAFVPEGANF